MQVETYEVTEVAETTPEQCEEARALTEQLGLKGQEAFYEKAAARGPVMPYRKMTAVEALVYSTLLPTMTEIEQYADGPIPLRVLQIAAHAKACLAEALGADICIFVWHPENADVKGPLLVAYKGNRYHNERYILARWGDELDEFGVLQQKAKAILKARLERTIKEGEAKLAEARAALDADAELGILTGKHKSITVYYH